MFYRSDAAFKNAYSWSRDNRFIAFSQPDPNTGWDLWALPVDGERKPKLLLGTPALEDGGWISPDGRWIAYTSDETGRPEVYVMPFPDGGDHYQVSTTGAHLCAWRQDGRELMVVGAVGSVTTICSGAPRTGMVTPASLAICAAHGPAALTIRPQRISRAT